MSQPTTEAAGIYHRRLPVYIVLDSSESMAGPAFDGLKQGLKVLLDEMLSDPMALETVSLSILTFHGKARVVLPLTSLPEVTMPRLVLGSGTSFGAVLELLAHRMNQEITIQTATRKGDWKPLVFILTDGEPTDSWQNQAAEFLKNISGRKANVIGVACGPAASLWALRQTTQVVVHLRDASQTQGFKEFFKWVSQSVKTTSARFLSGGTEGVALPELPPSLELAPEGLQLPGGDSIHLLARCEKSGRLFIMKYLKVKPYSII